MDYSGNSVASADINNDGKDDVIIGAYWADGPGEGRTACGEVYVIFYESFNETMDLGSDADMIIYGADASDRCGQSLATGDVNGDTIQDLIIGANSADGPSEGRTGCGELYVIFGNETLPTTWDLSVTPPDVIIYGPDASDSCGYALSTGDINGDHIDDIIASAYLGDGPGNARQSSGEVYLIFGNTSLPSSIDLSTQLPITIYGVDPSDYCGTSVAAGDINNDDFDDLIIGAYWADGPANGRSSCGEVYLIYGNTTLPPTIDLALTFDMKIYGTKFGSFGSYLGAASAAGDVNYDGYDDLILGASYEEINSDNVGGVHVFYGAPTLPSVVDLMNTKANVTIYGDDDMGRAGIKVVAGDVNDDSFDDIIMSASSADGPTNSRNGCGEIYIINGSSTLPSYINLSTMEEDVIIYGDESMDYTGSSLAIGNIDNDQGLDIIVGAVYADGLNNAKSSCGETYVILTTGKISPRLKPEFLGLANGDGPNNKICYARYKPYTFRVKVTDPNGHADIDTVTLGLDFTGEDLKIRWTKVTQQFQELSDPNDYIELSTTSKVRNVGFNSLLLYFNITFNWRYPDNELHGIQIYGDSNSGLYGWSNLTSNIYQVENQVDLEGTLSVVGETQGVLIEEGWIRGGELLSWEAVKIVYYGALDHYPPADNGLAVAVWDPQGNSWSESPTPGENITIVTPTVNSTQANVTYKLNITGVPQIYDLSNLNFRFNIDSDSVTFTNSTPLEQHWQTTLTPTCGIVVSDPTTQVKGTSIQYRISSDNGTTWQDGWGDANIAANDKTIVGNVTPTFENGVDNLIQWRAKDVVGNGFSASEIFRVYIDVEKVAFYNATPGPNEWQSDLAVECGITIFDNLSGINASSIEYRKSTDGVNNYSSWRSAGQLVDGERIQCSVIPTFEEGLNNYIQWRAIDLSGNGPYESMDYQIKIMLNNPPESRLLSPENGTIFQTQNPELLWVSFDLDDDFPIYYNTYLSTDEAKVKNLDASALLILNTLETRFKFETPLKDQTVYYWTVIPKDRTEAGTCKSGIWHFRIDTAVEIPVVVLSRPYNKYNISTQTPTLSWNVNYSKIESVSYNLFIDTRAVPETFISVLDSTSYIPTLPLIRGKAYFWTVIPIANTTDGKIQGECSSGIWWFTVDRDAGRVYGIDLTLDSENIIVDQGKSIITNVTLTNTGNYDDIFIVSLGPILIDAEITLEKAGTELKLGPEDSINLQLLINTYPDTFPRGYLIEISAFSKGAKSEFQDVSASKTLQLRVNEMDGGGGSDGTTKEEGDYVIWVAIVIVIVIAIVLLVVFLVMKRKKQGEKSPEIQAEIVYEPDQPTTPSPRLKPTVPAKIEVLTPTGKVAPTIAAMKPTVPKLKPKLKSPKVQLPPATVGGAGKAAVGTSEVLEPEIESVPGIGRMGTGLPENGKLVAHQKPSSQETKGPTVILPEAAEKSGTEKSSNGPKVMLPETSDET